MLSIYLLWQDPKGRATFKNRNYRHIWRRHQMKLVCVCICILSWWCKVLLRSDSSFIFIPNSHLISYSLIPPPPYWGLPFCNVCWDLFLFSRSWIFYFGRLFFLRSFPWDNLKMNGSSTVYRRENKNW